MQAFCPLQACFAGVAAAEPEAAGAAVELAEAALFGGGLESPPHPARMPPTAAAMKAFVILVKSPRLDLEASNVSRRGRAARGGTHRRLEYARGAESVSRGSTTPPAGAAYIDWSVFARNHAVPRGGTGSLSRRMSAKGSQARAASRGAQREKREKREKGTKRSYSVKVVGARRVVGDWYHALLRMTWTALVAFISVAFLGINALFAVAYLRVGGVAHARPGSFTDAFYFSVQTMGTIGYGAMYPESTGANNIVVTEAVVSLIVTALATGLVFSKFARPIGRVAFSRYAVIAPMEGVPTLMIRVGNERGNSIVEATLHMTLSRTIRTAEGVMFYKLLDLKLVRERSPAVSRSWTVLHKNRGGEPALRRHA